MPIFMNKGAITGQLGGKSLHCLLSASPQGSSPAAGAYNIQAPVQDATWGLIATMAPAHATMSIRKAGGSQMEYLKYVMNTVFVTSVQSSAAQKSSPTSSQASPPTFVLSSRPIPGRSCLVIQNNFADLMDALQREGGTTVNVS